MTPTIVDRDMFLQALRVSKLLTNQQFRLVVDKLHVNIFVGELHRHPGPGAGAHYFFARAPAAQLRQFLFYFDSHFSSATDLAVT